MARDKNIVYSTNPDWKQATEQDSDKTDNLPQKNQVAKIQREVKGRGGKTVTVVYGLSGDLKSLQKELQKHCGTGGSSKNGHIEIQGEHSAKIKSFLDGKGIKAKLSGGYK